MKLQLITLLQKGRVLSTHCTTDMTYEMLSTTVTILRGSKSIKLGMEANAIIVGNQHPMDDLYGGSAPAAFTSLSNGGTALEMPF